MAEKTPAKRSQGALTTRKIPQKRSTNELLWKLTKKFFAQFGTAIVAVAVVAYMFLQLMLNVGTILNTEHATYANIAENAELRAYLFRDEKPIKTSAKGTACYLAEDGEKVRSGEAVAVTYSNPNDVAVRERIDNIDKRIEVLEQSSLSTGTSTTNITMLDNKINELTVSMVRQADANEFDKILREKEELLILLNRRRAIVQAESYKAEIEALRNERESLSNSLTGVSATTNAPESGYFYSGVDGYENSFTLESLENLTCESFDELGNAEADKNLIEDSAGKIVTSSTWYIAVAIDKRNAEKFHNGEQYPITFQYSNNTKVNMTLERRVSRTDRDMVVLIFSTKVMPDGFDYSRSQIVELPKAQHEGLRVSTSAIRVKDGKTGVYCVIGTKVVFKETTVIYTYGSNSVCEIPKNPAYPNRHDIAYSSGTYLSLHDAVVVDGNDIYDGMRLK